MPDIAVAHACHQAIRPDKHSKPADTITHQGTWTAALGAVVWVHVMPSMCLEQDQLT